MPNSIAGRPLRPILGTLLFAITCVGATGVHADEKTSTRWFAHVEALANDDMAGRNTGSPGHKLAADYVAAQFEKAGLEPAMSLADPSFDQASGQQISIVVNPAHADKVLAGSGHTFAELIALADGAKPARSILFVAVTGEEKGLLGSNYFASQPTVPQSGIVANINTDMFLPLFPMKSLMVLGLDESDLGQDIRETAKALGVSVRADPVPQRNRFVRSDQYSFIKHGVPALAMQVGYEPNTPEAVIAAKWTAERYHAPSDDLQQPIDRSAAGKYVELVRDLVVRIANRSDRPSWNGSSFFKRFAKDATH